MHDAFVWIALAALVALILALLVLLATVVAGRFPTPRSAKAECDPWAGGKLYRNTDEAQRAFDAAGPFCGEQVRWCSEYQQSEGSRDDQRRIAALKGDEGQLTAWYWDDSYRLKKKLGRS